MQDEPGCVRPCNRMTARERLADRETANRGCDSRGTKSNSHQANDELEMPGRAMIDGPGTEDTGCWTLGWAGLAAGFRARWLTAHAGGCADEQGQQILVRGLYRVEFGVC
jgi:hypothetical protein